MFLCTYLTFLLNHVTYGLLWFQRTDSLSLVYPDSCTIACKVNTPRQTLRPSSPHEETGSGAGFAGLPGCLQPQEGGLEQHRARSTRCCTALHRSLWTALLASGIYLAKHWTENNGICLLFAAFSPALAKGLGKIAPASISPRVKRAPGGICAPGGIRAHLRTAPSAPAPSPALE